MFESYLNWWKYPAEMSKNSLSKRLKTIARGNSTVTEPQTCVQTFNS